MLRFRGYFLCDTSNHFLQLLLNHHLGDGHLLVQEGMRTFDVEADARHGKEGYNLVDATDKGIVERRCAVYLHAKQGL